jgi:hypothetical protein
METLPDIEADPEIVETCPFCAWTMRGPADFCAEMAQAHYESVHINDGEDGAIYEGPDEAQEWRDFDPDA